MELKDIYETDAATSEGIVYTYCCRDCDSEWKQRHPMDETPSVTCPSCGSGDTFRPIWTPKVTLEGGGVGWARDGYYAYGNRDSLKSLGNKVLDTDKDSFMKDLNQKRQRAKKGPAPGVKK